ncbi:kinase-like domain, phloem protein 2-like protein, partial [Tanacetum coccineum]
EDYAIWEPKLPKDYKEIIQMSRCPEDYSTLKKEDLYNIFSKGILLQQEKVLLSFEGNGERNEMVSATMFSYENSCRHAWKSLPDSRFGTLAEMLDISKLNIEIKINAQLLSPNVVYGVYLVFKLGDSIKISSKPMYVNLKYRKGHERLHAYFATWRDKEWMMIELDQFLNRNEDVVFEFLLESFSSYYCGETAVFVEGIEFRAIDKVKHDEIGKLMEVQQVLKSNFIGDQVQKFATKISKIFRNCDELFWLGEVDGKKLLVLSAKAALYEFFNVDLFTSKRSAKSRFPEVIDLLPQQVFYINCTIRSQMLSPDTEYVCYLVFKLSKKCQGLHCPVKVRDILHQENNEAQFVYFVTPSRWNINGITRVPKRREDGWMEIQLWKFNSTHEFKDDSLTIDMKFTSHEGTMSGLIWSEAVVVLRWCCGGLVVVVWCCDGGVVLWWWCGAAVVVVYCSRLLCCWNMEITCAFGGGAPVVVLWCCGGVVVGQWWCCGGAVVVLWWSCGGGVVLWVEINNLMVLHDHPLVDYGKYALGCMTGADMKKCVYLKSVRDELLKSMEEKRQLMANYRDM